MAAPHHDLQTTIAAIVRHAGDHLVASFERLSAADVSRKGVVDLVTRLDLEAQALVVEGLERAFPGEAMIMEEDSNPPERGAVADIAPETCWYIDPLDGTTNFVHGVPVFAVSVARAERGIIELGAVYAPYLREWFWAERGRGAYLNGRRLAVSTRSELGDALLATGFPYDIRTNAENNLEEWAHVAVRCRGLRRLGAAAVDLAYVAAGRFDGFWEFRLKPWDLAAGVLLVHEAGGMVTDPKGEAGYLRHGNLVATNGRLHAALLAELGQARRSTAGGNPTPKGV